MQEQNISSIELMERAAVVCTEWILKHFSGQSFSIFCGKGNNGGDGLAIARLLSIAKLHVSVYILEFGKPGNEDFQENLHLLHECGVPIHYVQDETHFPSLQDTVIIDALFGSGLNKPLEGLSAALVKHLNSCKAKIVSIDLPSGLFIDRSSIKNVVIQATNTLTFQLPKVAMLLAENANYVGELTVLDIGLSSPFMEEEKTVYALLDEKDIRGIYRPRDPFSHKGTHGHALLIAGSYGKMGAAVLAAKACLHAGVGLLSCFIPRCGYTVMQTSVPEAMTITDVDEEKVTSLPPTLSIYKALGVGPGIGTAAQTVVMLKSLLNQYQQPIVIDADALNILSTNKDLLSSLPPYSILTPHPKEFDRLFGEHSSDFDRIQTALEQCAEHKIIILLKGHHSFIAAPSGKGFFNSTGNAGMAKGGSGDVLTGILTSLLAQGYSPDDAVKLGVYVHGWAGDVAAQQLSMEYMQPSDLITAMSAVFLMLKGNG